MKKEDILNSTLELTSQLGIHNTPVSKIAKHAGVAVGTIYHHFEHKEEILNALYLDIRKEFGQCLIAVMNKYHTPREIFSQAFRIVYLFYTKNPLKFIFTEQIQHTPIISNETEQQARDYYQPMLNYLEQEIAAGTFRDIPVSLLGQLYYGNIRTLVQMKLRDEASVTDKMLEQAIQTSWRAFHHK